MNIPAKPTLALTTIKFLYKELVKFLQTTKDKSPAAVYSFLKSKKLSDIQVQEFLNRVYRIKDPKQKAAAVQAQKKGIASTKLPKYVRQPLAMSGINPEETASIR